MENNNIHQRYRPVTPPTECGTSHPVIKMITSVPEPIPQSRIVKPYSIRDGSPTTLQLLLTHHASKINIDRNELVFLTRKATHIRNMSDVDTYSVRDNMSGLELLSHLGLDNTLYCYNRRDLSQRISERISQQNWLITLCEDNSQISATFDHAERILEERQDREYFQQSNTHCKARPYVHGSQVYAFMRTEEFAQLMNETNEEGYSYSDWIEGILQRHPHRKEELEMGRTEEEFANGLTYNLDPQFNLDLKNEEEDSDGDDGASVDSKDKGSNGPHRTSCGRGRDANMSSCPRCGHEPSPSRSPAM